MRPLIGVTTYLRPASWSYWHVEAAVVQAHYVHAVEEAGARPLLVPPSPEAAEDTLVGVDGLVFTGGEDLDPSLYGQQRHPQTDTPHRLRDAGELALLRAALDHDLPVLAICRGAQVLNVALGGDLHQHVPDLVGHDGHRSEPPGRFVEHEVEVDALSRLGQAVGVRLRVLSHHHQAIRRLGTGLVATAFSADGLVEAVEAPQSRFAVGLLWHPEVGRNRSVFEVFIEETRGDSRRRHPRLACRKPT